MQPPPLTPIVDPYDGQQWWVDLEFLRSRWSCIWAAGCAGIGTTATDNDLLGCCSVGAQLLDEDEAGWIATVGRTLDPQRFTNHAAAELVAHHEDHWHTTVPNGACVFFNPPESDAPVGCALHVAALDRGEDPTEYKPSVCWQLPLKVDRGGDEPVLRRWTRDDWGPGGAEMAWCCSQDPSPNAFVSEQPVYIGLKAELLALCGPDLAAVIDDVAREADAADGP